MASNAPTIREEGAGWAAVACVLALLGFLYPVPSFVEMFNLPPGSAVRPMGQAAAVFLAGLGTPLVVAPCAFLAFRRSGVSRWLGVLAAAVSLLPFPTYWFLFGWIVRTHHLTLLP